MMSTADKFTYFDGEISRASRLPGVGQYNAYRHKFSSRLGKWNQSSGNCNKENVPAPTDYAPDPANLKLFSNIKNKKNTGSSFTTFTNEQRFKETKVHKVPFHVKQSEWGMKSSYEKKDILSKVSKGREASIYYG